MANKDSTGEATYEFRPDELITELKRRKNNDGTWRSEEVTFPKVGGRLRIAHEDHPEGGLSIRTGIVHFEPRKSAQMTCEVVTRKGTFQAHGFADATRDGQRLEDALLELAETRSIARALRFAGYGVEYTGAEEISHTYELERRLEDKKHASPPPAPTSRPSPTAVVNADCAVCGAGLDANVADYCLRNFHRVPLCMEHQKAIKDIVGPDMTRTDIIKAVQHIIDGREDFQTAAELREEDAATTPPDDALNLDAIADIYDAHHSGRPARTLPIDKVLKWAEDRTDLFRVEGSYFFHAEAPA